MSILSKRKTWLFAGIIATALLSAPVISYAAEDAKAKTQTEQKTEGTQSTLFEKIKAFFAGEPEAEEDKDAKASEKDKPQKESAVHGNQPKVVKNAAPPPVSELGQNQNKEDLKHESSFEPAMSRGFNDVKRIDSQGI